MSGSSSVPHILICVGSSETASTCASAVESFAHPIRFPLGSAPSRRPSAHGEGAGADLLVVDAETGSESVANMDPSVPVLLAVNPGRLSDLSPQVQKAADEIVTFPLRPAEAGT